MKASSNEKIQPRRDYWRDLIGQQERSGQAVQKFCSERSVKEASFYHWRKQLRSNAPVSFALVEPTNGSSTANAALEVVLASGDRVQVVAGTDAATFRMVLAALRERV
jgi:transposase-like protein